MPFLPSIRFKPKSCAAACLLAVASLAASAQESPATTPDANTHPVAAEVNGVRILRQEVDYIYGLQPAASLPPEAVLARKRAILADLVRGEVMAQKAAENKLDQGEVFEMEMAMARRKLLADKVERQILGTAQRITAQQALDFVNTNPRLFAERQLLTLEVMNLNTPDPGLLDRLDQASDEGAGFEKLERLVREAKGSAQRKVSQASSETLPPELLKTLTTKPYKTVVIKFNDNQERGMVMQVRSATPAPLTGNEAVHVAGNLLQRRQLQTTRINSVNALVNAAQVNYYGLYQGVEAGGETSLDAELVGSSIYTAPVSRRQKIGIAAGVAAASTLLVLLLLVSWRYWSGNSRRTAAPGWLQRLPLLSRLIPQQQPAEALAQAVAALSPRSRKDAAAWYGKLLVLLCLAGCAGLLWMQSIQALSRLPQWVLAVAGSAGLVFGLLLAWVWVRSHLVELERNRRWLPVPVLGLLTASASAVGLMLG